MATRQPPAPRVIYQLKITLRGSKPPIWRRVEVAGTTTLAKLHTIIQIVMGWHGGHLHQFAVGQDYYSDPSFELDDARSEKSVKLSQVAAGPKAKISYEYDFGDSWEHELLVEKLLAPEAGVRYPRCVAGKRAGPPDDVGGVWGYAELLERLKNTDDPEHDEQLEWLGGAFDPEAFDIDEVNQALAGL